MGGEAATSPQQAFPEYLPSMSTGYCYRPGTGQHAWGTRMSDSVALSCSQTRRETDVFIN